MKGEPIQRRNQNILLGIRIFLDQTLITLAWVLAYFIRFSGWFDLSKGIPQPLLYFKLLPFIVVIWSGVFTAFGFYRRTGKHRTAFVEALDILQSCALATLGFIAFSYFYEEYRYSRWVLILFAGVHPWLVISGRSLLRKMLRLYRRNAPPRQILIIGSGGSVGQAVALSRLGDLTRGEIRGVLLAGDIKNQDEARKFCNEQHIALLEQPTDWSDFFVANPIQSVVIALPYRDFGYVEEHLEKIVNQVSDVKLLPDVSRFTRFASGIELIAGTPVISIHESPLAGVGAIQKRFLDIVGGLTGILLFSPLMIAIAALVKLTSKGPVFFAQERMGLDGKLFKVLKFRSMRTDAEAATGAVFAKPGDSRTTTIGAFLRRTSLDEIPQFFNVLRGDMSLVGPRPERPVFVHQFRRNIPGYMLRHKVKAGLTGWAQINGWRGDTSIERRIECDLFYIQNWSLWLDIRIMLLTTVRVLFDRNAY